MAAIGSKSLVDYLAHARQRAGLIAALGVAALLVLWALPRGADPASPLGAAQAASQRLEARDGQVAGHLAEIEAWLARSDAAGIARAVHEAREQAASLQGAGIDTGDLEFLTLDNEFDRIGFATGEDGRAALPADRKSWTFKQLRDFASLSRGYVPPDRQMDEVRELHRRLSAQRRTAAPAELDTAIAALGRVSAGLERMRKAPLRPAPELTAAAADLTEEMQRLGIEKVDTVVRMAEAKEATDALRSGSLSVLGFTIPGLAVRLLLPLTALVLAFDLFVTLARGRALAVRAIPAGERAKIVGGYPWLLSPTVLARLRSGAGLGRAAIIPLLSLLLPLAALLPLLLSGQSAALMAFGLSCVSATAALEILGLRQLVATALAEEEAVETLPGETTTEADMLDRHAKSASVGLTALALTGAAVLAFFVSFALAPRWLLEPSDLEATATTRKQFETAYDQRLREQPDAYARWCATGCEPWTSFAFAADLTPPSHPARPLLDRLAKNDVARAQSGATSRTKDLVTESRARLRDLDAEDVAMVKEVLYRQDYGSVVAELNALRTLLARHDLPEEARRHLPQGVFQPDVMGIDVPFPAPYRVIVERGGFADSLAPLPPEDAVARWLGSMERLGIVTVGGFDAYSSVVGDFGNEIGKVSLKIAGINVPRAAARDAALAAICLLALLLGLRLRQMRLYADTVADRQQRQNAIAAAPGFLFAGSELPGRLTPHLVSLALAAAPLLVALTVASAPGGSTLHPAVQPLLLAATALAGVLLWRERLRVVISSDPRESPAGA